MSVFVGSLAGPLATTVITQETITVVGIITVAVLIALSAFFASSEIAIFALGDHRISSLVEDDVPGAKMLDTLKANPRRLLVTILIGNNIANIGMSSITTGLLAIYFGPTESVLIATFGVTSLILLFGESAPKSYAVENSESWSLRIARPLRLAQYVLYPLIVVFDALTRVVNKVMGSEGDIESAYVTRSEIQDMLEAGQREGVLADEEHLMLQRLLRFRNRIVKETMVPRLDVVAVSTDADPSKAIEVCLESGFSQLPVYDGSLDNIVGTVDIMDLLANRESGATTSIRELASEPYVVPETKDVDELLIELRNDRQHIAIAVDEFGTTAGIVSVEDIVEEIIGEILTQTEEIPFRWLDDDTALVRGEVNVHMVNEALGTALPETNEFETIAGFMLDRAGRVVEEGETVTHDSVRLSAEITENNRILEVRVDLPADEENSAVRGTEESRDAESEDTERRGSSNKNAE